jgi:acetylornithine deacetylase/succinyl-diaminopimelate desuccinylase-like protein
MLDPIPLLQELIRNRCENDGTAESGHEHRSVATLEDLFAVKGEVVEPSPGRQSVIYRIPGRLQGAPSLLLLPHLDVVPVNRGGWSIDPFAAEIADGFVWGRGAVDMLNVTAAMAVVFAEYFKGNLGPLPGDLVLAAVADEEAAGGLGARYLVEQCPDLVATDFVLTEVAYPSLETSSGPAYPISVGEKGPFWSRLIARGIPGHGSAPYLADNALEPLARAITGLFETPTPVEITPEWVGIVQALDLAGDLGGRLIDPNRIDDALTEIAVMDPGMARYFHAVTHLTVSPNTLAAGIKANVIADYAEAEVDVRGLPGMNREFVDDHLRKAMGQDADRIEIVPMSDHVANVSDRRDPLWTAIEDSLEELTGERRALPILMPVTTDARFFRARGKAAYGVGLFDDKMGFSEFLSLFHGNDERVSVESVRRTTDLLARVVARFGELTG